MPHNYVLTPTENPARVCAQSAPTVDPADFFGTDVSVHFLSPDDEHDRRVLDGVLATLLSSCAIPVSHPCVPANNIG